MFTRRVGGQGWDQGILFDKEMLDQRMGGSESLSEAVIWRKRVPDRGNRLS